MNAIVRGFAAVVLMASALVVDAAGDARPIDERGFVEIGGIEQWIAIQGERADNPVILFLHGGPAEAQSPFLREFEPWQRDFTVVNWDQRGAGKTYGRNGDKTTGISLERMADDAIEVALHARRRLDQDKLILVGHSWGAILGLAVVQRRPDLFHAFVGTGQPVSWALSLRNQERWAREQATAAGDEATLKALDEAAGLPDDDFKRVGATRKYRMTAADLAYLDRTQGALVGKPPYPTTGDVGAFLAGGEFTGVKLWPTITTFDARKSFPEIAVPFIVIQGRDDHVVSFDAARDYVATVRAPAKAFVPIAGGHFALFTEAAPFVAALRTHVLPTAAAH